ncbi:DUF1642 domain-containing protein [Pediococcus acidilactici]|uniref:DUF1642 domain-containing protein n=1 Tax=Pediococcus acidilactici TaxID=1254 RepID=A0AAW8YKR2_PEDAC|nr:DUF1642 domain-containing protein [Pediococcus acidilactici]MDV2911048.1 DUF1642 domain-containing protein [Pediococcus acidilactici]WQS17628.1 DUF1642 domain-containing protein [Pediococcus acidilactici]
MNLKELRKKLQDKEIDTKLRTDNPVWEDGYERAMRDVRSWLSELDEPEKVTIPQCIATLIEENKTYGLRTPLSIAYYIAESISSGDKHYQWLKDEGNQKLLLNAIASGYEIEGTPKGLIQVKQL